MRFLIAMTLFFSVAIAQAEIVFAPAGSYLKLEDESDGVSSGETEITNYDLKLAYLSGTGLYLGGMYQSTKINDDAGYSVGPTLGFSHYSGFYALFTYFLMAEQDAGTSTFTDGMGPQVDVGWIFPVTRMFLIGPQISYRSINYDKADVAGTSVDADFTRTNVLPYISLWFRF